MPLKKCGRFDIFVTDRDQAHEIKDKLAFDGLALTEGSVRHFLNRENILLTEQTYQPEKRMDRAYLEEAVLSWYNQE